MSLSHRALVLLVALLALCARGGHAVAVRAPQYPALERGDAAFRPFVRMSGGRRFESREVSRKPRRKDLKVTANYPVLVGDGRPGAREFNRRARAFVLGEVTPYLYAGRDLEKERSPHWKDVQEYVDVSHKVVYASDEVASVLFYVQGYNWGAGHGYHRPVTLNFDLRSGREIELARLFRPGSNYLRVVAAFCAEDLKRQFAQKFPGGLGFFPEGFKPRRKNFGSWVFTPDGLVLIFEEYQVVSYADGEPKVLIPFERLREIIDPRGPLARLAAHEPV